jgi:hypothetical protein
MCVIILLLLIYKFIGEYKMPKVKYYNAMCDKMFKNLSNRTLAKSFARDNVEKATELMDSVGYPRWFVSEDPAVFALNLLKAGPEYMQIALRTALVTSVSEILGLEYELEYKEIRENWRGVYKKVRSVIGEEKSRKILKEPSLEEVEKDIEELCKINLG